MSYRISVDAVRIIFLHFAINIIRFSIAMHFRGTVFLGNAVMYDVTQQIGILLVRAVAVTIDGEAVKAFTAADDEKEAVKATRKATAKPTIAAVKLALLDTKHQLSSLTLLYTKHSQLPTSSRSRLVKTSQL